MKRHEVKLCPVPQIEGLRVQDFLDFAKGSTTLQDYLPDPDDWVHVDKEWLCNVLNSVDYEGIQKMVHKARKIEKRKACEEVRLDDRYATRVPTSTLGLSNFQ